MERHRRPFQWPDDSDLNPSGFRIADGVIYTAVRYVVVYGEKPPAPLQHLLVPPREAASGVVALED